jgi:hypothetical protein
VAEQLPATLYPLDSLVPPQRITPPSSRLDEAKAGRRQLEPQVVAFLDLEDG